MNPLVSGSNVTRNTPLLPVGEQRNDAEGLLYDLPNDADAPKMRTSSQTSEGSSVAQRLILLVLLPLTALTVTLGIVANDRWEERQAGAAVVGRVDDLRALVALQSAIYDERTAVEIELRSASFGVPAALGAGLLGITSPAETYDVTDAAAAAARRAPQGIAERIASSRDLSRAGNVAAIGSYDSIDNDIVARIVFELDTMQEVGIRTADRELVRVLEQLEASVLAFSASTDQSTTLADSWFGTSETRAQSLADLGPQTARFELALADIDPSSLPEDFGESEAARNVPIATAVAMVMGDGTDAIEPGSLDDLPFIIGVFEASFARNDALSDLVGVNASQVQRTATRIANDNADAFVAALALGAAAILASVLASWRLAGSIAVPMVSVASRTRQLQAGQIEATPLELAGPRELRDVASAINDVSVNLEALEGKLDALARADLDDSSLSEPLPGRLGETLMNSVDTLSASIADRRSLQARLGHQANHDGLTGLANRAAVLEQLSTSLAHAATAPVGLLFVDLDDFKRANDVYGHAAGDQVLVEVGRRLLATCRPSDMVARLGGDEFLVVVESAHDLKNLERAAQRIVDEIVKPMPLSGTGGLTLAASVGIARVEDPATQALDFLSHADAALYLAKSIDSRIAVFDERLEEKIGRRATIEQQLHVALAEDQFEVHYQPVLASGSLRVCQVEALVRWTGQDRYGPDDFIPIAEQSDLVIDIDCLVLHTATRDVAAMIKSGVAPDVSVAVNLSGRHLLHADVATHVADALAASGLDPSRLIVEVTETALVADLDRAALHLTTLRSMGVRVSVDDFGTGFTSISQLRRLPIDELKIDRSLVMELPGDETLVRVVRDLAQHFGMTTVAEGVETEEQAKFLKDLGCSQLQGWLYARAMSLPDLHDWFGDRGENRPFDRVGSTDMH